MAESLAEPERFDVIVDAYKSPVYRYLARWVGPEMAEDLAAKTFLRARSTYKELQPTALPWLYRIATNLVRDHAPDEHRRLEALARSLASQAVPGGPGEDLADATDATGAVLSLERLGRALAAMPVPSRDVVGLVGVEGLSYEEASAALGVPVGTVRSRVSRARRHLRDGPDDDWAIGAQSLAPPEREKGAVDDEVPSSLAPPAVPRSRPGTVLAWPPPQRLASGQQWLSCARAGGRRARLARAAGSPFASLTGPLGGHAKCGSPPTRPPTTPARFVAPSSMG